MARQTASGSGTNTVGGKGALWKVHAVLVFVQWSTAGSSILSKIVFTSGVNPIIFTVYRDAIAFLCLAPSAFFFERNRRPPLGSTNFVLILLLGTGLFVGLVAMNLGIAMAPAAYSYLPSTTTPIFAFVISAASGLQEIRWTRRSGQAIVAGVVSTVFGSTLTPLYQGPEIIGPLRDTHAMIPSELYPGVQTRLLAPTLWNLNTEGWQLGGLLLIFAGIMGAIYWTLQAQIMKTYPAPITLAASAHFIAFSMTLATALVVVGDHSLWATSQLSDVLSILYAGVVPSGVIFGLENWIALSSGAVLLAVYKSLQSFAIISMAYLFLGESIHLGSVLGLCFITNGLFLITWGEIRSRTESGHLVKVLPSPLDSISIGKGDFNLEQRLLE